MTGHVRNLGPAFGFIRGEDGRSYFFHDSHRVDDGEFGLLVGDVVSFEPVEPQPPKGPRARAVVFVEGQA